MSDQEPYIVCMGSYGSDFLAGHFDESVLSNIVFFEAETVYTDLALDAAARAASGETDPEFAAGLILSETLDKISPIVDAVNQRGYPPAAVISCPFFAKSLLVDANFEDVCAAIGEFSGKVHLIGAMEESRYEESLAELFDGRFYFEFIELGQGREKAKALISDAVKGALGGKGSQQSQPAEASASIGVLGNQQIHAK